MSAAQRMWKVMRALPNFTQEDLIVTAGCTANVAKTYVSLLFAGGYLKVIGSKKAESGMRRKVYMLVRNTGPKAPARHDCLYDPNTRELYGRNCEGGCLGRKGDVD